MINKIKTILYHLLDDKLNLDSGICEQITGRVDKDYILNLEKIINKRTREIINKIMERDIDKESETRRESKTYEEESGLLEEDKI